MISKVMNFFAYICMYYAFCNKFKKVKHIRNYHTYYDLKLEKKALKGEELDFACWLLRSMVEYVLLHELDLPKETIHRKMRAQTRRIRDIQAILEYRRKEK
jgi:ApeA N-terminal domain 1